MNAVAMLDSILSLAASEALAAGYAEITAGHLLIALAKISELNGSSPEAALGLATRQEFELLGIDPRRFRRRLRELFGRGKAANPVTVIHRSPACKAVISHAEELARASGVPLDAGLVVRAAFIAWVETLGAGNRPDNAPVPTEEIPTEL
jgi:hypothetical protein